MKSERIEVNSLGISNFKPFGNKLQRFNIKPITLIYGPNSIGKSSLIHAIAYQQNLHKTKDFSPTEMEFGDKISIGGFEQFIHRKNTDNIIELEYKTGSKIEHAFDEMRTGKYSFSERKLLFDLSEVDIRKIFDEKTENFLTEWFYDVVLNIPEDTKIDAETVEDYKYELDSGPDSYKVIRKPMLNLKKFLDDASELTKKLFNFEYFYAISYDEEYFEFEYETFTKNYGKSDLDTKVSFASDLKKYILLEIEVNDEIKVNTKIGLTTSKTVSDLETEYFIGDEWLLRAVRNEGNSLQDVPNSSTYTIQVNSKHWFVDGIIYNISKYGKWKQSESDTQVQERIYDYIDEIIFCKIPDIVNQNSILLDSESLDYYDSVIHYLMEWSEETENRLKNDFDGYYSELEHKSDEFTRKAKRAGETRTMGPHSQLLEVINDLEIQSLNDVITFFVYSWITALNKDLMNQKALHYIGPLRFLPERYEFSYSNKLSNTNDSESTWTHLKKSVALQDKINHWLSGEKLKTPYELKSQKHITLNEQNISSFKKAMTNESNTSFEEILEKLQAIEEFSFYDKRYDTPVNIREMGLGVSQILPILVNLYEKSNTIIAVEQPELHLHPAIQSTLADEFIESYRSKGNYALLETHSEHLLLRLMKRMRQTFDGEIEDSKYSLSSNDVCILYVDADGDKTYITELHLDDDGSLLDPWPGGFFEEGFAERFF